MPTVLIAAVLLVTLARPVQAVTVQELVDLSKAGLSDDILIALVEAEKSVFRLTATDVQALKREGLSDRLLLHLLQTPSIRERAERVERAGRASELERRAVKAHVSGPAAPARAAAPDVVYVDRVRTIPVPVYVPVIVAYPRPEKPEEPVYWGWGGKRRPGSWKEPSPDRH